MKFSYLCFNLGLLILGTMFSAMIINIYWVTKQWNDIISNLGDTSLSRTLMSLHFAAGICAMILYPLQKILVNFKFHKHTIIQYVIHGPCGLILFICGLLVSLGGIIYILTHRTVGGIFMDITFAIYGTLIFCISVSGLIIAIWLCRIAPDNKNTKFLHYIIGNMYGTLIFSSLFYRILYTYARLFGYPVPSNSTPITFYQRPLDRLFQIAFFTLPLIVVSIYNIMIYKKYKRLAITFTWMLILFMIVTIIIAFIV